MREANKLTKNSLSNNFRFFLQLRRNHYPPYYIIPGIHDEVASSEDEEREEHKGREVEVLVLGGYVRQSQTQSRETTASQADPEQMDIVPDPSSDEGHCDRDIDRYDGDNGGAYSNNGGPEHVSTAILKYDQLLMLSRSTSARQRS